MLGDSPDPHPYIFPSFPSGFRMCVPLPTAAANGPRGLNFGMKMGLKYGLTLFGQSGSKVKGQGPKSMKRCLSRPLLVTGAMCGTIQDQGGSGGVLLAACQLILATCKKAVERQGVPSTRVSQYWQVASVAGKLPKLKKVPVRSITRQRDARCSSPRILHTFRPVNPPHWQ